MSRTAILSALLLALAPLASAAAAAAADDPGALALAPRLQPGDAYALSLTADVATRTLSGAPGTRRFAEDVRLAYQASVVVLEVDGDGRPVRERHDGVRLTYERPEGRGSLFQPGASFDVQRGTRGGLRLSAGGRRLNRTLEQVVAGMLDGQLEHTLLPALLDPGRPVAVGERWELDRGIARRLLRERGLRVVDFGDAPATASLEGDPYDAGLRRLRYRIPVSWLELTRMPADSRTARSGATLEGELLLAPDGFALRHDAQLELQMNGVLVKSGVAPARAWQIETSRTTAQRTEPLQRVALSGR